MGILPVIDLLDGTVVRGVAGNRAEYRPIQSRLTDQPDPLSVADALRRAFGFRRFYVADLDGILFDRPTRDVYRQLADAGSELLIDAGVRDTADIAPILNGGASSAIVGLETLRGPATLGEMIQRHGPERIIFSLDLQSGRPNISKGADWIGMDAEAIAAEAVACGVRQMIVLDLADVGTGTGGSTAELCLSLLGRFPELRLIAGGGVRGPDDLRRWSESGIAELLVASALHDGRLTPEGVNQLQINKSF